MTTQTLLQKLVNIILESSESNFLKIPDCFQILLGTTFDDFSDNSFYNLYKENASLSLPNLKILATKKWNLKDIEEALDIYNISQAKLSAKTADLYKDTFNLSAKPNVPLDFMFEALVYQYFFGTPNIDSAFETYTKKNCINYVVPSMSFQAFKLLKRNNLLFITGAPGTGKSELAKYIIASSKQYKNIGWLESLSLQSSLDTYIQKVPYLIQAEEVSSSDIIERFPQNTSSILVIDLPSITPKDFDFIRDHLKDADFHIIITTRTTEIPSEYNKINLDSPSFDFLKTIFTTTAASNKSTALNFSDNELLDLFNIIDHNPLMTVLVARTLDKALLSKAKLLDSRKWIYYEKGLPSIHTSYRDTTGNKSGYSIVSLMQRFLTLYPPEFIKTTANRLSIWTRNEIDRYQLIQSKAFTEKELNTALNYGILRYTESTHTLVQMPNLIADAIWLSEPISFDEYAPKIYEFLEKIRSGEELKVSYCILYTLIADLIYRFHFNIIKLPARPNLECKNRFNEWNRFLMTVIIKLTNLGNHTLANDLYNLLFLYNTTKKEGILSDFSKEAPLGPLLDLPLSLATHHITFDEIILFLRNFAQQDIMTSPGKESALNSVLWKNLLFTTTELFDYLIRMEKNFLFQKLADGKLHESDTYDYQPMISTFRSLHMPEPYWRYYDIIGDFLSVLHKTHDYQHLNMINKKIEQLHLFMNYNSELYFKILLQQFFYNLMMFLENIEKESFIRYYQILDFHINQYNALKEHFMNKIWSWDTTWLFHSCTLLLDLTLYPCCGNCSHKVTSFFKADVLTFVTEQLTLTNGEVDRIKQYLKEPINPS